MNIIGSYISILVSSIVQVSDKIAVFALVVSVMSALFAGYSWRESRRANRLTLLPERIEIHTAFEHLKMHMIQKSSFADSSEVAKFFPHLAKAKVYLPRKLSHNIDCFYTACFQTADIHRTYGGNSAQSAVESTTWLSQIDALTPRIEKAFSKLLKVAAT